MKIRYLFAVAVLLCVFVVPAYADNSIPGLDSSDPDIVDWLTWVASPAAGALVAWFLEKTRLSNYVDMLQPEARRWTALIISGVFGIAATALLSLVAELPAGSTEVINALLAMVFSQLAHGRLALGVDE